ncbi:helix-turn-helix domain-containing protein [Anaerovibrio sp.]|uniref:helix-turn-helix domain-containing protein n=1 Tax=Anaerovibrio sp. TaxID=1872532 RepID=UPI0038903544
MAIRAYDEMYVDSAQNILGHAVDFAIMSLEIEPNDFAKVLMVSASVRQFAKGNPRYVAGMNGCELARQILDEAHISYPDIEDIMYVDKSPEYWSGWALAYYQWYADVSFGDIFKVISLEEIIGMYSVYHEMNISHFVEQINRLMGKAYSQTRLRARRDNCGLSQSELAKEADVPLRQIQLFEQGQRDINKTSAITLYKLSKALHCQMEDLLEPSLKNDEEAV